MQGRETPGPRSERDPIEGCTCAPWLTIRGGRGRNREPIGRDIKQALHALNRRNLAETGGEITVIRNAPFSVFADEWLHALESKESTRESYRYSVNYAVGVFGGKRVRRVTASDIVSLNQSLRERGLGASTRAKHLKVISACFQSAVAHGYAGDNPVRRLPKSEKPRSRRREAAYFEDAELGQLMGAAGEGLHRTLLLVALKTGMRLGELSALAWADVDLGGSVVHVRRSFSAGRLGVPKSHEKREVELTEDVVRLLGEWWGSTIGGDDGTSGLDQHPGERRAADPRGVRADAGSDRERATGPVQSWQTRRLGNGAERRLEVRDVRELLPSRAAPLDLVFPRPLSLGHPGLLYLPQWYILRHVLYAAMTKAGIPREGPTGELRTFHSLRHTYARICLEHGVAETWLQRQLGHSSLAVTTERYGHWSKEARKREAKKLSGAFVV